MRELTSHLARYATATLAEQGVELVLGERLVAASPQSAVLSSGTRIPTRTLISTVPSSPNPIVEQLGLRYLGDDRSERHGCGRDEPFAAVERLGDHHLFGSDPDDRVGRGLLHDVDLHHDVRLGHRRRTMRGQGRPRMRRDNSSERVGSRVGGRGLWAGTDARWRAEPPNRAARHPPGEAARGEHRRV